MKDQSSKSNSSTDRERKSQISRFQVENILESVSDSFVALDTNWVYTYVNGKAAQTFGRTREQLIGKHIWTEFPEGVGQPFYQAYYKAVETQQPIFLEEYYPPYDRWFENRIYPSKDGLSIFFHDITDRKKAELGLRETEERLSRIVETLPNSLVILDGTGQITFANPAAEKLLELKRSALKECTYNDPGWRITALDGGPFHEDNLPFSQVIQTGKAVYGVEHAIERADGTRVLLSINAAPLHDTNGELVGVVTSISDITDRKQAEILAASEKRVLEMVAKGQPLSMILEVIARNIETQAKGLVCTILLLDPDGLHVRHGAAPSMPATFIQAIDGQLIGPNAGSCGTAAYRKEPVYVSDIATDPLWTDYRDLALKHGLRACWSIPIKASNGKVLGTFAMYYGEPRSPNPADLRLIELATNLAGIAIEDKQTKDALRQSEEKFNKAFHNSPDAITITRASDGLLVEVNEGFERISGLSRDEVIGHTSVDVNLWVSVQDRNRYVDILRKKGLVTDFETNFRTKAGEVRNFALSGEIYESNGEHYILGIIRDITERKRAEAEIRQLNAELEQRVAERTLQLTLANKELEAFSYSISHDLRAPLRAVSGFSEIIARRHRAALNAEGQHYIDNIVQASERMGHLIDDLLNYSRLGRAGLRLEPVSLARLLAEIAKEMKAHLDESYGTLHIEENLPDVVGDGTLLNQIFTNLLENAIKYRKTDIPPRVEITSQIEDGQLLVKVSDNGIGIPLEYQEKIFNVFQRLHSEEQYPGTGIGLATVKKSVELLGGSVWVESQLGEGSTFFVKLPKE